MATEDSKKPPFVDNSGGISLTEIKAFSIDNGLDEGIKNFLLDLWQWLVNVDQPMSIYVLAGRADLTPHGLRNRLEKLTKIGVFKKVKVKIESARRPVVQYRFHCAKPYNQPIEGTVFPAFTREQELMIENDRQRLFFSSRIDDLICTSLFSALPAKASRKPLEKPMRTIVNWFEMHVEVVTRSETGKAVASTGDLKYYIAILSICYELVRDAIRNQKRIDNRFAIDLSDIHSLMDKDKQGGNIETAIRALDRLSSTVFEIPHLPERILKHFDERLSEGFEKVNPLHDFSCYSEDRTKAHRKTIIKFGLPIVIFNAMLQQKFLFEVNPAIYQEDNDVMIGFHLWCRRRIGVSGSTLTTTLQRLHRDVAPTLKYKEFLDRFHGGLRSVYERNIEISVNSEKASGEDPKDKNSLIHQMIELSDDKVIKNLELLRFNVNVYGYRILRSGDDKLVIVPNPADRYVGVQSAHNRALSRRSEELDDEIFNHKGVEDRAHEESLEKHIQQKLEF